MLTEQEIRTLIENDEASEKKTYARIGERYYEAEHDIRDYLIFFYDAEGELKIDETKSNIKISHPYFTELVDQLVQYLLSNKEAFIKSDDPQLQKQLDIYFNKNDKFCTVTKFNFCICFCTNLCHINRCTRCNLCIIYLFTKECIICTFDNF